MEDSRIFAIEGEPAAKGRPRFKVFRGHAMAYTPAKTKRAEQAVKEAYKSAYGDKEPFAGAIWLSVEFYMPIPKSLSKKKREELRGRWHCKKPDVDNLLKLVQDALNGLAWKDDSQIVSCAVKKLYTYDDCPKTRVIIKDLTIN